MTVSTEISHNEYLGNGVTTSFPYTFRIFKDTDLDVSTITADGLVSPMILGTDYMVTGAGLSSGGSVITSSPVLPGITISITRNLPAVQETDLRNQGKFFAEVHEDAFDYLTMLIQHAMFNIGALQRNTLRVPENSVNLVPKVSSRRNMIFGWDDSGQPIAILPPSASASEVLILLAQPDGWKKIGGVDKFEPIPITVMPSYNQSNVVAAWVESVNLYGYVYFPCHSATKKTYTIPGTASQAGNLQNSRVIVDKNVILKFDSDLYSLYKSLKFEGECTFEFSHLNFTTTGGEVDYLAKQAILNRNPIRMKRVEWSDCVTYAVDGDSFIPQGPLFSSSDTAVLFALPDSLTRGLFVPIAVGEHVSGHIRAETNTLNEVGIVLRCSNGWIMFYGAPGATQWSYKQKITGGSVVDGNPYTVPGGLQSYSPGKASVGIVLQSKNLAILTANGVSISLPLDTSAVGDVYEVGFVANSSAPNTLVRVTGVTSYTSDNGVHCKPPLNILIHGDSTAEDFISAFSSYIPQLMDGANGHRSYSIVNKAVAGQTMRQQLDLLKAQGPGDAYIVIMVAGTNEGQANQNGDYMAALIDEFVLYCNGLGRIPV
ncbi:TPA: phage tail protein, partial [Escherichia coli]|nr:phage tail protein [Escherichia coli]